MEPICSTYTTFVNTLCACCVGKGQVKWCGMNLKRLLAVGVSLLLASCVGTKEFTVETYPEGAEISINGKKVGTSPVTVEIKQDKNLGIVAFKPGYEVTSHTVSTQTSNLLALIWTKNDPKAQYIEEDSVEIPMKKIQTIQNYKPSTLPEYTGGGGRTAPQAPALRPMPGGF